MAKPHIKYDTENFEKITTNENISNFIIWMTKQKNVHGTPYSERVALMYSRFLQSAPMILELSLEGKDRNVFDCRSIAKFEQLCEIFHTASNYQEVDYKSANGAFTAGLEAYRKYLDIFGVSGVEQIEQLPEEVKHVDFNDIKACAGSDPISCSINNINISFKKNWRDLLAAITEYCISMYTNRMGKLKNGWYSYHSTTPYLLLEKPLQTAKRLSNGFWINVHYSIPDIVKVISGICKYCDIDLKDVDITYKPKEDNNDDDTDIAEKPEIIQKQEVVANVEKNDIPYSVIDILSNDYPHGFTFDVTALRLLSDKAGIDITGEIQNDLKTTMFHRNDDIYFIRDIVADSETQKNIIDFANDWLDEYGFFEISELYELFADNVNANSIRDSGDFEDYYKFINTRPIRCTAHIGKRTARNYESGLQELSNKIAEKIVKTAHEEYGDVISEDDLKEAFPAFSTDFLEKIIKEYTEELIRTEINGIICYQTLDALGLSDDFSDTLAEILDEIEYLGLTPNEEVLHTALSIRLGINFRAEYNIPDGKTYRRLIEVHYKNTPARTWKKGVFTEV